MDAILSTRIDEVGTGLVSHGRSAASWSAIIAGAFVAAAVSLFLLSLGAGLGLASVSPWTGRGLSATKFAITTAIWLIVMQWVSAGLGGYITGRLRTRWIGTHTHEVFFRDTAHGLVTWALATVVAAVVLASSVIGDGVHATDATSGEVDTMAGAAASYDIEKLFRASGDAVPGMPDHRGEAAHIVAKAVTIGTVPPADRLYLATLIAQKTGVSQEEAQKRVDGVIATATATADAARKTAAKVSIFTALSMLIGAFIASVSAALGGRLRDEHP
jgi:hypothetical protein